MRLATQTICTNTFLHGHGRRSIAGFASWRKVKHVSREGGGCKGKGTVGDCSGCRRGGSEMRSRVDCGVGALCERVEGQTSRTAWDQGSLHATLLRKNVRQGRKEDTTFMQNCLLWSTSRKLCHQNIFVYVKPTLHIS